MAGIAGRSIGRMALIVLTIAVFGLGSAFGAVATWRGVAAVLWAGRVDGSLSDVECAYIARGGWSCGGSFRPDGSSDAEHVAVEGVEGRGRHPGVERAQLVRKVNTFGYTTVQHRDTAYVGSSAPSVAKYVVIAVILTFLALLLLGPVAVLAVLRLMIWRRGRDRDVYW